MSPKPAVNNVAYINDVEYSIRVNRWFLKPIGVWPSLADTSLLERITSKFLALTCQLLIMSTVLPCVLYIVLEEKDLQLKLKAIGPLSHYVMGSMNYGFLLSKNNQISRCINDMALDWRIVKRLEDREVMLKNAKFGRFIALFSAVCMQFGALSFVLIVGTKPIDVAVGNLTVTTHLLPCRWYQGIVDTRFSPANEIVLLLQLISCFVVNCITVGACGLAAVLAMHSCGQLHILMARLDEFVDQNETAQGCIEMKLASIVQHHLRILGFIARIEEIMHQICLVELVGCTFNLCMLGYYCITEWNEQEPGNLPILIILLVSMTFNIFIFCYIGQILKEQCQQVGQKAYMINWYYLPHKTALSLILIISRSNVVIKITAGKLIQLSIATFGEVIKTSVTYLNILRTVTT